MDSNIKAGVFPEAIENHANQSFHHILDKIGFNSKPEIHRLELQSPDNIEYDLATFVMSPAARWLFE